MDLIMFQLMSRNTHSEASKYTQFDVIARIPREIVREIVKQRVWHRCTMRDRDKEERTRENTARETILVIVKIGFPLVTLCLSFWPAGRGYA